MTEKTIIYTKGGQDGDGKDFLTKYCRLYRCEAKDFSKNLLFRCIFLPAAVPARLIWLVHRGFFDADMALIEDVKTAAGFSGVWDEVDFHSIQPQGANFLRRWFKIRMSKTKLLRLARLVFRNKKLKSNPGEN